jgi:cation diffusion facilitator CzcD-associated flavoprotein CzcO
LIEVAEKWGLYSHIRFNSSVSEAHWDDESSKWGIVVDVGGGKEEEYGPRYILKADFLIAGVGQLNQPHYPDLLGLEEYSGKIMHSARWDWSYSMKEKRVGIIGNGATAAQIIPELAKEVKTLVVFQRTPNWVIPREDRPINILRRTFYRYLPTIQKRYRAQIMDMREEFYMAASVPNTAEKDNIRTVCVEMMQKDIPKNANLRDKLTPEYPPGCKRVISSDDFFSAMNQSHVLLETERIRRVTRTGLSTGSDGNQKHELDCLILATGFKTQNFLFPMKIVGTGGRSLHDVWKKVPLAFRGVTVESMPNFGMLYGPNTNLGHNSIILMIEAQSRYLQALIAKVIQAKQRDLSLALSPKPDVVEKYNEWIQDRLQKSTFADPSCRSWYKTAEGQVTNNWCGTVVEYQQMMSKVEWQDYEVKGPGEKLIHSGMVDRLGRVVEETSVFQRTVDALLLGTLVLFTGAFLWARSNSSLL